MKLHQNLPVKQRRIIILLGIVVVLSLWSLVLPPTDLLEYESYKTNSQTIDHNNGLLKWHPLNPDTHNFQSWNLEIFPTQTQKNEVSKIIVEKIIKKVAVVPSVTNHMPVATYQPPIVGTANPPQIKYLGQVVDSAGLQIFLSIDNSSVMMKPKHVYEQTWEIIVVDDNEIRLKHIPTQQILHISKL